MKQDRQRTILDLIRTKDISTQNQLMDALNAAGHKSTQATVSRDIKELNLIKEFSPEGVYRYAAPGNDHQRHVDKLRGIFKESVISLQCAQNLIVMKTLPGLASAACSALDHMEIENLVGTLAGDDTAFLAMTTAEAAETFRQEMEDLVKP